ncbi:MAG: dihydroorotase [Alphaproteobacteria bacterium]|nr:dihydroorotase [Alphaproteobacteria bacterium]
MTQARPIAFLNATLVDPEKESEDTGALLIKDGLIADQGPRLFSDALPPDAVVLDTQGLILAPGLVDSRVFTGEPGSEHRETLSSASEAAVSGGVTAMVVMPNTEPVIDDVALVDFLLRRARDTAKTYVYPMAALTKGLKGESMTEMGLLAEAGAVGFTQGLGAVANAQILRRAMTYARDFDLLVETFPAEPTMTGQMNAGEMATRLGLSGLPVAAEAIAVDRDLRLAELTGARVHISPISCAESVQAIARAKKKGLPVTCATTAAHLGLNEHDIGTYLTFRKLMPPLRSEMDRLALIEGVADGTVDIITSGHDPQPPENKRLPFAQAAFGGTGLETLLAASLSLARNGSVSLPALFARLTLNPARLFRLPGGRLTKGAPADLVLFDADKPWVVNRDISLSRSKNEPFDGQRLQGRVIKTIVGGHIVYDALDHARATLP